MNKPKKRKVLLGDNEIQVSGYNMSCDDWEAFLPDVKEIYGLLIKVAEKIWAKDKSITAYTMISKYAEIIAKRIGE